MFSPKMSLFLKNFMKLIKKCDPEDKKWLLLVKNGHLTLKTHLMMSGTHKNMFWGHFPIFPPERSISFFKECDKLIEESFQRKKNGCHPSNNRLLTQKTPPKCRKTQFLSILHQKEFAESGFETLKIFP